MIPEGMPSPYIPRRGTRNPMPPLQYAVYNTCYTGSEAVLAQIETGAELDAVDVQGLTALHRAVSEREPEIYALLVHVGADQHICTRFGVTPARLFEQVFGVTCEEKFKDCNIDVEYFRRKHEERRRQIELSRRNEESR